MGQCCNPEWELLFINGNFFSHFAVYSFDGLLVLALLMICTCAYITKVPRLKSFFLSEKKGFFGVFYKGKLISANYCKSFQMILQFTVG